MATKKLCTSLVFFSIFALGIPNTVLCGEYYLGPVTPLHQVTGITSYKFRASNDVVVWQSDGQIMAYDFVSNELRTVRSTSNPMDRPDTSLRRVIWGEKISNIWQIMSYDLDSGQYLQLTDGVEHKVYPSIENEIVLWEQTPPTLRNIYMAQPPAWEPDPLFNEENANEVNPDISNGRVLYDYSPSEGSRRLRVYDLSSEQVIFEIVNPSLSSGIPPRIHENIIGWYEYNPTNHTRIVNIETGQEWNIDHPTFAIGNGFVAYHDEQANQLWLLDLADETTTLLRDNVLIGGGAALAICGNKLIWEEILGGEERAVFSAEIIPEPATLSLLAIGGLAMLRRRSCTSTSTALPSGLSLRVEDSTSAEA